MSIRRLPLGAAIANGAKLARWHRKRHGQPSLAGYLADFHRVADRLADKVGATDLDLRIVDAYARAALRYPQAPGTEQIRAYERAAGGLWAKQWGNIGTAA